MPLSGSRRKTTTDSECWFAASSQRPLGSMEKCRGQRPPVGTWPTVLSRPEGLGAKPRIILTHPYISAELLYRTPHSMVGPFFHRNTAGVSDTLAILMAKDDQTARAVIARRGIEWILLCSDLTTTDPAAFHSRLLAGHRPSWLRPVALDLAPEENFSLYQVVP